MQRQQSGLSLLELMLTTGLVAVLAGVGIPSFRAAVERNQIAATNNQLIAALSLARSEALRQRGQTVVCPARDADSGCQAGGDWTQGWMVFLDRNGNRKHDTGETVFAMHTLALSPQAKLYSGNGRPQVRYAANGRSAGSNISIRLCQNDAAVSAIIINNGGRPRLEKRAAALRGLSCG